ncbi:hypothetical protein DV113_004089 [Geotrichum candidum]|nr:hypothetical protein DV113_004089 [Geotrichum candidum]
MLWLCHRATRLLKIPASQLITTLGIEIPEVPNITLDAITCTSVLFHWAPPEKNVVKYVFQLDGKKALSTAVSSKSSLRNNKIRNNDAGDSTLALDVPDLDDDPSKSKHSSNKLDKSIYTVESLEKEVELIQSELQEVLTQKSKLDLDHANSEQVAQRELELAKAKRKTDELSRAQLKTESKSLEETKHSLDTQRMKIEKANKLLSADLERKTNEKNKWVQDIESAKLKIAKLDNSIKEITDNGLKNISTSQRELEELQAITAELDEKTKELVSSTKKTDSLKSSSLQALTKAKGKTDKLTGIINDSYVTTLLESPDVHPKLKEAMKSDLDYENQLEEDWKKTQKDLETRYLKVNLLYNEAKKAFDKSVEVQNKPPPSDSNPVYEAVAAAAAAAAGNSNAGNFPTNPAEAQGHPIAPTTSNPPSGKKRRNRSRRNTKSQASGTFVGSPQQSFVALGGTNSPLLSNYAGAPLSPSNSLHSRNIALLNDNSPDPAFASLTPSKSGVSIANGPVNWDFNRPGITTTRSSEMQNPNVLLPSYLLKDDGTDNFNSASNNLGNANNFLPPDIDISFIDRFTSGRPSGGILGRALHEKDKSQESLQSPIGSIGSAHDSASFDLGSLNHQDSPQPSFNHLFSQTASNFPMSPNANAVNDTTVTNADVSLGTSPSNDNMKHQNSKGRFGSMFFFGKPCQQTRSNSGGQQDEEEHSQGHSLFFKKNPHRMETEDPFVGSSPVSSFKHNDDSSILGNRRRSGSLNSIGSLPVSLGESFNGNSMLNLWNDGLRNNLESSRSHISTTLSIDRNPAASKSFGSSNLLSVSNRNGFDSQTSGLGWSAFSNPNRSNAFISTASSFKDGASGNQLEATWDHIANDTIIHNMADDSSLDAQMADISSTEGTSPQNTKSRFGKGFANFFSSSGLSESTKSGSSFEHTKLGEENLEQESLGHSTSDAAISIGTSNSKDQSIAPLPLPKETILQKSIRTFSLPRKGNNNSGSGSNNGGNSNNAANPSTHTTVLPKSKFTMRRLSMFSKKGSSSKESEEELDHPEHLAATTVAAVVESSDADEDETMDYQEFLAQAERGLK